MSYSKVDRVNQLIQRELTQVIPTAVKDPRLPHFVTVTAVKTTRDLGHAKIYITVLDSEGQDLAVNILNQAAGFLRSVLAKNINFRRTPKLLFVYDKSTAYAQHIESLLTRLSSTG